MNLGKTAFALLAFLVCGAVSGAPSTLTTLALGSDTAGIAVDPVLGKVFVSNYGSGTLSIVDVDPPAIAATIPIGQNPRRLISNAATGRIYVVNDTTPGTLTVFDSKDFAIIARIPVGNRPRSLAADFAIREIYVCNSASNTVTIVDTGSNTAVATIPVGTGPGAPSVNHRLGKIYVVSNADDAVSVIDRQTRTVKTIAVGKSPASTYVAERVGLVLVNNTAENTVSVIDSATDTVIRTLPVGAGTTSNFITGSGVFHRAYLPNALDNTLTIIDTDALAIAKTVPVGATPIDVVADGDGGDVYVVNSGDRTVTVIDGGTEAVVGSFAVGASPWRVAVGLDRLFVLNQNGSAADSMTIATKQDSRAGSGIATEFYHAGFDHYFHSASEIETRLLVDGLFGNDWDRTFVFWRVWTAEGAGRLPVCRFFSAQFAPRSSHFFTPYANECASLKAGAVWQYEDVVYGLALPDIGGNCATGTVPLYRLYNDGKGGAPNHRYTPDRTIRDAMRAAGWTAEGYGNDIVFACMPTLTGR